MRMRERVGELAEERENNCSHFASTSFCLPSLSSLLVLGPFLKNDSDSGVHSDNQIDSVRLLGNFLGLALLIRNRTAV